MANKAYTKCKHHNALKKSFFWKEKEKKECTEKDEWVKKYGYCQNHICVLCHKNTETDNKGKIGDFYYYCKRKGCEEKGEKIVNKNGEIRNKLINSEKSLLDGLKNNSLVDPDFVVKLEPFLKKLWEDQIQLLNNNYLETPVFTDKMIETIKWLIEGWGFLSPFEKSKLALAYTKSKNIDDIISEIEETLNEIGKSWKSKKETDELSAKRAAYIQNLSNLDGWNLLTDKSKNYYFTQITNLQPFSFDAVINSAKSEIKRIKDERERERERERDKNENPNRNPPRQPENPDQPGPNSPSPKSPDSPSLRIPDKQDPSDNSQKELEEIKRQIKSAHNLTEEEYNAVVAPLNDKNVLEYVSLLLGKVKEVQAGKNINTDTIWEFLSSYSKATANSAKKRAYEAVNNYQHQVDKIITDLQSKKQVIKASLQELVSAESEEKLNQIYEKIKSEKEVYKDNNQKIIDNHKQRVRTAIKLEIKSEISETEKQLAGKLRVIINAETEKNVLQKLSQELSEFKSTKEGEKKVIYKNYSQTIDLMLGEIKSELDRREHSQKEIEKAPPQKKKNFSENQKGSISVPVIIGGVGLFLVVGSVAFGIVWRRKKRLKLLKRKKVKK